MISKCMRRILIGIVILLSCLEITACKKNEEKQYFEEPYIEEKSVGAVKYRSDTSDLTMEELIKVYPDKAVLTWVYNDMVMISPSVNQEINELLVEQGYDFVILFQRINEASYESTINQMIEKGNAPDLICAGIGEAGTLQGTYRAVKNGWLLELESYLESEKGRILKEAYPEPMWNSFRVNGPVYGVNGMLPFSTGFIYYVNKALADKYNIALDELATRNPAQLDDLLEKVYQGEHGDNFITYIYEENYNEYYYTIFDVFNISCSAAALDMRQRRPQAVNLYTEQELIDYFIALADYREKGYLTAGQDRTLIKQEGIENFFIIQGVDNLFGQISEEEIHKIKNQYPEVKEVEVVSYAPGYFTQQGNSITGICAMSEQKDYAFEALTAVFTDEKISNLLLYGFEENDYVLQNDRVSFLTEQPFSWVIGMYFGNPLITTPTTYEPVNKREVVFDTMNKMMSPDNLGVYIELTDITKEIEEINRIVTEYYGLYDGSFSQVGEVIVEMNQKLEEANFQHVLDEINRRRTEVE